MCTLPWCCSGCNLAPPGSFVVFLAHRNHVRVAQFSYCDGVGWCLGFFPAIRAKDAEKWIFPVLGAALGETPADQICLHARGGPSEPCLGSHVSLGSEIRALWGGLGSISLVGDRFGLVGSQPTKNHFGRNSVLLGSFWEFFGSSEPRSRCATFLR